MNLRPARGYILRLPQKRGGERETTILKVKKSNELDVPTVSPNY
jgi:hypothetical protein